MLRRRTRVPFVAQPTQTDCGPAALTSVARYHGADVPLFAIRTALGGGNGTSIESLERVGRELGFETRAVSVGIDELDGLSPASILFWRPRHFVVYERHSDTHVFVVDPAFG